MLAASDATFRSFFFSCVSCVSWLKIPVAGSVFMIPIRAIRVIRGSSAVSPFRPLSLRRFFVFYGDFKACLSQRAGLNVSAASSVLLLPDSFPLPPAHVLGGGRKRLGARSSD
jgi:hypothetical protein